MAASEAAMDCRSKLPTCCLTDDDFSANPGLTDLLMSLGRHINPSGVTITLAQTWEEARRELYTYRANWLKCEILHRLLKEALLNLGANPSLQDKKFLETLEQQLLVADLKRMLGLHSSLPNPRPSVLEAQHLAEFLPPHQDLEQMKKRLPAEMEKFLKDKCLDVLGYYFLESDNCGEVAQLIQFDNLVQSLATEKQQLKEARAKQEELTGYLDQQKETYCKIQLRCLGLLKQLVCEFRLGDQSKIDQFNIQYLENKCKAMLLKIRNMEVKILSETYTPEVLNVHRIMRDKLHASLSQEEQELATSRKMVSNYEILGPEFEELVKKYTQLQEKIQNKRWMLNELMKN